MQASQGHARRAARSLFGGLPSSAALALLAVTSVTYAQTGGALNASASLASGGWIAEPLRPPAASRSGAAPGAVAAEAWYVAPPSPIDNPPPWQVGAAGYARVEVTEAGTAHAAVHQGTAALARAVASATGAATATLNTRWQVDVVINPFLAGPLLGDVLYQRLVDQLGCQIGGGGCLSELDVNFLHLTRGSFEATPGQPTGRASFSEGLTITAARAGGQSSVYRLDGNAAYGLPGGDGEIGVTWGGGWGAADGTPLPLHQASDALLFPAGDPRNALTDPAGALTGLHLQALREFTASSRFDIALAEHRLLPFARFQLDLAQTATAGFAFGYGNGSIAANFDDTAISSVLGIDGLSLLDADGRAVDVHALLQVYLTPLPAVPEPPGLLLAGVGALAVGLLARRRGQRRPRGARPCARALPALLLGLLAAAAQAAQAAAPPALPPASAQVSAASFTGAQASASGVIAGPGDRVTMQPVTGHGEDDNGARFLWGDSTAQGTVEFGALRAQAAISAGIEQRDELSPQPDGTGAFGGASAWLGDRIWVPAAGYATLDLRITGAQGGGGTTTAGTQDWRNWDGAWFAESELSWRLGTMPSAVAAWSRRWSAWGARDFEFFSTSGSDLDLRNAVGPHPSWELLAMGPGLVGGNVLGVRLRIQLAQGVNPFELALAAFAECQISPGGTGFATCDAVSDLSRTLHVGNLTLFQADGTPMPDGYASASGYDWRLPLSAVPEPAPAALMALGAILLLRLRRLPALQTPG
jgi:hypothetical protein